jgi:hypothetical protein
MTIYAPEPLNALQGNNLPPRKWFCNTNLFAEPFFIVLNISSDLRRSP